MTGTGSALAATQLLDRAVVDDPYPFYRSLREQEPVWRVPGTDVVLVSSFAAITEAVNRPADFSSNLVSLLYRSDDGTPGVQRFDAGIHTLATADPPAHSAHRGAVFPELVARRMAALRADVVDLAETHIQAALTGGHVEAMATVANAIPIRVVSTLIGFQDENPEDLLQAAFDSTEMLAAVHPLPEILASMERTGGVMTWISGQLDQAIAGEPAEGILGVIAAAVGRGELDAGEGFVIMATLLSAGGESTTSLLGNALHILATDLDLQQRLRAEPGLLTPFIEEVLRLESPFRYHMRHAREATELAGVEVPAGATVLLLWGAANRDPAEFDGADELRLDRAAPRHHVGFGRGIHLCVGAPLARLEADVILGTFLARTAEFTLDADDPPVRVPSLMVRRFERLPLRFSPALHSTSGM